MTPQEFVKKWGAIRLNELAVYQPHFMDVCALIGHPPPLSPEISPDNFRFEAPAQKADGRKGRADAFYRGKFIWEYKGAHANLEKAYEQVLRYRESLGNPPLLIVSDTQRIVIRTNFTNTITETHELTLEDLLKPHKLALLKTCFAHADDIEATFRPKRTQEQVTKATANSFLKVANTLKQWDRFEGKETPPEKLGHFIVRLLFCLFAEDMALLPDHLFTELVSYRQRTPQQLMSSLRQLFIAMRDGGVFGPHDIPYFNGRLFDDNYVPDLPGGILEMLHVAARQDWSGIDPTIFGTLFERIIDPNKRAQLGAHYTSKDDIMLIVEPVLMQPLRQKWETTQRDARRALRRDQPDKAHQLLQAFANDVATKTVLDPACGSGNFLYIALQQLLSLQKEAIVLAEREGLPTIPLTVGPQQLYGIELNPYAHELAQITIWIGYIQWRKDNGFPDFQEPILLPLDQIERKDAILAYDENGRPVEPEWPAVDVIIGNPPFLGGYKRREQLGENYLSERWS